MPKLTQKQEGFCLSYIETGNASEAYRLNYGVEKMKPATVNRKAKFELDKGKIRARLTELQERHQERHNITVDSLTAELYADRAEAKKVNQFSASIAALMHIAKLHGLITDKQKVEVSGKPSIAELLQQGRERVGDS